MTSYAENTAVSSDKSRAEIEATLVRYGATGFGYGWQEQKAMITFKAHGRRIRFVLPMPNRDDKAFWFTAGRNLKWSPDQAQAEYEQAVRQKWRALALAIKAKLEAVATRVTEFEDEFLAHIVQPNGQSAGAWMRPQIETAYEQKKMPPLLGYDGDAA
jgi:hypothetical protein